jgi:YggT family protein
VNIVCSLITIYTLILLAAIVLSWFRVPSDNPIGGIQRGLRAVTEPVLAPIRNVLPPVSLGGAGLDLSPLVLFLGLNLLQGIIC